MHLIHSIGVAVMAIADDVKTLDAKRRTGLEVATFVSGFIFVAGVIFSAGIQFERQESLGEIQLAHGQAILVLQQQLTPMNEQLARQDALLSDIRDELRVANTRDAKYQQTH